MSEKKKGNIIHYQQKPSSHNFKETINPEDFLDDFNDDVREELESYEDMYADLEETFRTEFQHKNAYSFDDLYADVRDNKLRDLLFNYTDLEWELLASKMGLFYQSPNIDIRTEKVREHIINHFKIMVASLFDHEIDFLYELASEEGLLPFKPNKIYSSNLFFLRALGYLYTGKVSNKNYLIMPDEILYLFKTVTKDEVLALHKVRNSIVNFTAGYVHINHDVEIHELVEYIYENGNTGIENKAYINIFINSTRMSEMTFESDIFEEPQATASYLNSLEIEDFNPKYSKKNLNYLVYESIGEQKIKEVYKTFQKLLKDNPLNNFRK